MKRSTLASQRKDVKWSDAPPSGVDSANYGGGKYIDDKGYVRVLRPEHPRNIKGYTYEHRLVMEAYLDRFLEPWETVHHINEIKTDNRIENLFLCSYSEHSALHKEGYRPNEKTRNKMRDTVKKTKPHTMRRSATQRTKIEKRFGRPD